MRRFSALVLALSVCGGFGTGCSDPVAPDDEPEYSSSDVQIPEITMVNPPFFGQTVAIVPFVNKSLSEYRTLGDIAPDLLAEMALEGGWRVVESNSAQLDAIGDELNFGQSEMVDPSSAAKIGNMLGAKYVLIGAVTNFKITKARAKSGVNVLGLIKIGGKDQTLTFDCQVAGRIVDVETREIVGAGTASVKQQYRVGGSKTTILFVTVEDGSTVEVDRDSMGKVLRIAFARVLNKTHKLMNRRAAMMQMQQPAAAPAAAPARGGAAPIPAHDH